MLEKKATYASVQDEIKRLQAKLRTWEEEEEEEGWWMRKKIVKITAQLCLHCCISVPTEKVELQVAKTKKVELWQHAVTHNLERLESKCEGWTNYMMMKMMMMSLSINGREGSHHKAVVGRGAGLWRSILMTQRPPFQQRTLAWRQLAWCVQNTHSSSHSSSWETRETAGLSARLEYSQTALKMLRLLPLNLEEGKVFWPSLQRNREATVLLCMWVILWLAAEILWDATLTLARSLLSQERKCECMSQHSAIPRTAQCTNASATGA